MRTLRRVLIAATAFLAAMVLLLVLPMMGAMGGGGCGGRIDPIAAAAHEPVAGYKGDQLANAAEIMAAATAMNLDARAQVIGVMTAMGESSLRNITYGDWETSGVTNPDGSRTTSIGLFQQQNSWGTAAERTTPATAARLFFERLVKVTGWENLTPSAAAHAVQINADPNHYTKWYEAAADVVNALTAAGLANATITCAGAADFPPADGTPPGKWGGYDNGRIPAGTLQQIPWAPKLSLRADAVAALAAMNAAFRAQFGYDLPMNDAYRDYPNQVKARQDWCGRGNCNGAADPGTSNHGWALAVDIGDRSHYVIGYSHPIYLWLKANAGRYGWAHPQWAEPGDPGGPDEAWHWEYYGIR